MDRFFLDIVMDVVDVVIVVVILDSGMAEGTAKLVDLIIVSRHV